MKISIQWILAAIIVLLIILVGAYALTNGNNAPADNATATPTTTPTATVVASPSVTPSTAATATPAATASPTATVTPTVSSANGVKLTDFGYYITYPPFSQNEIHVNPNYVAGQSDTVYFDPTSVTIDKYINLYDRPLANDAMAVVHRSGNLSGTTHVIINVSFNDYIEDLDFTNTVYGVSQNQIGVTFGPGESEKTIGIYVWPYGSNSDVGQLTLKITGVDGVDSIGSNNQYTLNVNIHTSNPSPSPSPTKTVQFATSQGWLRNESGCDITQIAHNDGYYVYSFDITVMRTGDLTDAYTPDVELLETNVNLGDGSLEIQSIAPFQAGQDKTYVYLNYRPQSGLGNPYCIFNIFDSGSYSAVSPNLSTWI